VTSIIASQAWEDERRKASKSLREAKAAADSDLLKLEQSLADAEQQRHEAVRQCEAEGHRSAVKLAQAGRSLKAAKQEAAEAQKQAKVLGIPHRQGLPHTASQPTIAAALPCKQLAVTPVLILCSLCNHFWPCWVCSSTQISTPWVCRLPQSTHSACKPRVQRHHCFMSTARQLGVQHVLL